MLLREAGRAQKTKSPGQHGSGKSKHDQSKVLHNSENHPWELMICAGRDVSGAYRYNLQFTEDE